MWQPVTFEERLIDKYFKDLKGDLYLKVELGETEGKNEPITISALLISSAGNNVHLPEDYSNPLLAEAAEGKDVNIIESCHTADGETLGKLLVGTDLVKKRLSPANINRVLLCGQKNVNIEDFARERNIKIIEYEKLNFGGISAAGSKRSQKFVDIRKKPDESRKRAFLKGWKDAVSGDIYSGAYDYKTHANMGNLFGWIYGDVNKSFRKQTWERYIDKSEGI